MIYPGGDINVRQRVNSLYCCNGGQKSSGIWCKSCAIRELKLCERLIVGFVCRRKGGGGGRTSVVFSRMKGTKNTGGLWSVSVVANNLQVCLFSSREARNIFLHKGFREWINVFSRSVSFYKIWSIFVPQHKNDSVIWKWSFLPLMTENLTQEHAQVN